MVGRKRSNMYGQSNMETCILPYVKYLANGNLLCDSGNSNRGSVTTSRGPMGREVGRGSSGKGYMCIYGGFMLMFGRNKHNVVDQLSFN